MKALCWNGKNDVRVETVPDPTLLNPRDAIVRVTSTAICGSDLHLFDGYIPTLKKGDILGHEFMGEEAHGTTIDAYYDKAKQALKLETDRPHVLREAIQACRKGGTVSIPGVYGGLLDKVNFGAAFGKGLTLKMGQIHVHRYMRPLLAHIEAGDVDPSRLISHRLPLAEAPHGYKIFRDKEDHCVKIVLQPNGNGAERVS